MGRITSTTTPRVNHVRFRGPKPLAYKIVTTTVDKSAEFSVLGLTGAIEYAVLRMTDARLKGTEVHIRIETPAGHLLTEVAVLNDG